jgi:hypothetical protein
VALARQAVRVQHAAEQAQPQEVRALPAELVRRREAPGRLLVQARLAGQAQAAPQAELEGVARDGLSLASGQSVGLRRQIARSKSHNSRQVRQIASLFGRGAKLARRQTARWCVVAAMIRSWLLRSAEDRSEFS